MSEKNESKGHARLMSFLKMLASPAAMGVYLTFIMSGIAFRYYNIQDDISEANKIFQTLNKFDLWSVDARLNMRGPRYGSPDIAILAVDDRSIEIAGRWPWPRSTISQAMENAYKNGAKVIATDIVWSEPSDRPEKRLINELIEKQTLPPNLLPAIEENLNLTDPDRIFADFVDRNKEKFVIGNFFENISYLHHMPPNSGYISACHDLIKDPQLQKISDLQAIPPVIIDNNESVLSQVFKENYVQMLDNLEIDVKAELTKSKSAFEKHYIDSEVLRQKELFCNRIFLNPENTDDVVSEAARSNWAEIRAADPSFSSNSFDEWLTQFKSRNLVNAVPETLAWTINIPQFTEKSQHFGYFNARLDDDGTIRKSQLLVRTGNTYIPSISLQAYLVATEQNIEVKVAPHEKLPGVKGIQSLTVMNSEGEKVFDIPVTPDGAMVINYAGPGHTIPHASIADLLNENDPDILVHQQVEDPKMGWVNSSKKVKKTEFLKNKILIIGATAIGVFDLRVTPFDENFPGVETHANVVDNLLRQDFLSRHKDEELIMPGLMLLIGLILSFVLSRFGAISCLVITIFLLGIMLFIDRTFLFSKGHLVSILLPVIQVSFTYVFLNFYKYFTEERSKKELRATFSKYVSPAIVEEILKDPKNLELGGRKERVTVFFSDVRGFTTISEKLDPQALSDLLNSYLTPMTDLVFKNRGTLDKYMGDAIMSFFGAPVHYPDHAKMACRCALQNLEKLKELQAEYARKGLPQIDVGIGLNTGECSVGNMGSQTVRSYTVMGDAVNLASRLEGINKTYGTHIIISEFTHEEVKGDFLCREVDWVKVKGKVKPVKIYELLAEGRSTKDVQDMVKYFADGYAYYREKQFDKAIQAFNSSVAIRAEDETSKIYIERCQEFLIEPPPSDWDGVYVMKTK